MSLSNSTSHPGDEPLDDVEDDYQHDSDSVPPTPDNDADDDGDYKHDNGSNNNDDNDNDDDDDDDDNANHRPQLRRSTRIKRKKTRSGAANSVNEHGEQDFRNVPITQILRCKRKRSGMKPMPSTVKRLEERKRQRLEAKNSTNSTATTSEQRQQNNDNDNNDENENEETSARINQGTEDEQQQQQQQQHEETPLSPADSDAPLTLGMNPVACGNDNYEEVDENGDVVAPQVMIDENGEIIIDQASLFVSANTNNEQFDHVINNEEHTPFGNNVTSASFKKRERATKWSVEETERFYEGLRTFGTDFTLMTKLFVNRTRRQLKHKFKREEKECSKRIDEALSAPRIPIPDNLPTTTHDTTTKNNNAGETEGNDDNAEDGNSNSNNNKNANTTTSTATAAAIKQSSNKAMQDEVVGRVSDDEDVMLDAYDMPQDDFDEGMGGYDDIDSDDD